MPKAKKGVSRLADDLCDDGWQAGDELGSNSGARVSRWRLFIRALRRLVSLRRHWGLLGQFLQTSRLELQSLRRYWGQLGVQLKLRKQWGRIVNDEGV